MTTNAEVGADGDVAVIGAGLAGLAAARHLQSRGRRPVVYEATSRVGGRQRSNELGGTVIEEGAVFFGSNYPNLWRCLAAAQLDRGLKTYDLAGMGPISASDGSPSPSGLGERWATGGTPLHAAARLPGNERLRLAGLTLRMAPRVSQLRGMLGHDASSGRLRRLDDVNARSWFARQVGPRFADTMVSPIIESLSFADATEWSALGALVLLTFSATPRLWGVLGGNDRIAKFLADPLAVCTDTTVTAVSPDRTGVDLELDAAGQTTGVRFRDVVLAVPGPVASGLVSEPLRGAIASIPYSPSVVPAIVTESPLSTPTSSFYEADGDNPISGMAIERPLADGPVLCYAALRSPWREELLDGGDDDAVELLAGIIERDTGVRPEPVATKVVRWRHSVPVGTPGHTARQQTIQELVEKVPHLVLAGDYLVSPSQEGALVSGVRAANSLL
jgi:oxygen-dependent protoporphyrinogen oxidase